MALGSAEAPGCIFEVDPSAQGREEKYSFRELSVDGTPTEMSLRTSVRYQCRSEGSDSVNCPKMGGGISYSASLLPIGLGTFRETAISFAQGFFTVITFSGEITFSALGSRVKDAGSLPMCIPSEIRLLSLPSP